MTLNLESSCLDPLSKGNVCVVLEMEPEACVCQLIRVLLAPAPFWRFGTGLILLPWLALNLW